MEGFETKARKAFQRAMNKYATILAKQQFSDFDEDQLKILIEEFKQAFIVWQEEDFVEATQFHRRVRGSTIWEWLEGNYDTLKSSLIKQFDETPIEGA